MAGLFLKVSVTLAVVIAIAFQLLLKDLVWMGLGIGKHIQPLSDFPYKCRRIDDPRFQACEDMWLSESTRQLFMACSTTDGRKHWIPNGLSLNVTGRSLSDAIVAVDIDKPKGDSFEFRALKTPGFTGTAGDGLLNVLGVTGVDDPNGDVELLLNNNRPSLDPATGAILPDQTHVGANSTLELFRVSGRSSEMKHLRTFADAHVTTPNSMAPAGAGPGIRRFYMSNSGGPYKTGLKALFGPLFGSGDITYCDGSTDELSCKVVSAGHKLPNGMLRNSKDGLIYAASSVTGIISVFRPLPDGGLAEVDRIDIGYGLDNLSEDANGDIWASIYPRGIEILMAFGDPWNAKCKAAVVRVRREADGGYSWEKVLEDGDAEVLPGSTVAVHDSKTGRLFFGSVYAPYIGVCEPIPA
ncbi:uncharacterized protein E0L32_011600 [Thyridium curvatum]|uniref:Uncharacterized protein n=1 Tax=Thyridium curvatum TaxID=1093900 RepID=A0A507BEU4_9PEZI|nr:uncharacterized protein E0L32_011600 [Thyridium curvatum]TPX18487.1 hypothetical protein E0L32_011600 [Thyridium curvatum]